MKWMLPVLVMLLMLAGCPYKSDFALDTKGKKVNPALLGKWEPKSGFKESYNVTQTSDFTYRIVKMHEDKKDSSVYSAYLVDLDGDQFLNLQQQGEMADKGFYFYKVELNTSGSKVTLWPVTENISEKFATAEEMRAFFKKYKGLSFFYDKQQEVYIKD
jgi:hypothetical protein